MVKSSYHSSTQLEIEKEKRLNISKSEWEKLKGSQDPDSNWNRIALQAIA
jgi:hypothetical protein